ncbi:MAG: hypothetical protein R2857_01645 [Vampirovibrionales bacterium]
MNPSLISIQPYVPPPAGTHVVGAGLTQQPWPQGGYPLVPEAWRQPAYVMPPALTQIVMNPPVAPQPVPYYPALPPSPVPSLMPQPFAWPQGPVDVPARLPNPIPLPDVAGLPAKPPGLSPFLKHKRKSLRDSLTQEVQTEALTGIEAFFRGASIGTVPGVVLGIAAMSSKNLSWAARLPMAAGLFIASLGLGGFFGALWNLKKHWRNKSLDIASNLPLPEAQAVLGIAPPQYYGYDPRLFQAARMNQLM